MSDLRYKLIVDMETRGSLAPQLEKVGKAGGDLSKVKDAFGGIMGSIGSAAGSMAGAFTGAVEAAAGLAAGMAKVGVAGGAAAIGFGVKINSELEQAQTSLAAIFNSTGQSNGMLAGMKDAQSVMKDMRKDAAELPGEFKDLVGIFRMAATPGFQAGGSIKDIEKLSANSMAFAASRGIEMGQAGRELGQLLQGRAGGHNVFGTLLGLSGDKAQAFNAEKPEERLKTLQKELKKEESSRDFFGSTFDALSSTLVDNGKKFLGAATSGVFDRLKGALETTNAWFDRNEEKIIGFAESVGERLSLAFEWGRAKITEWTPAVVAFVENAYARISSIWERVSPMLEKAGDILKKALSDPATFDRIEGVLKMYAAVKIGGAVAPAAGGMFSGISGLISAGAGSEGLGAAGVASLGMAAGVAAVAVAAIGVTAYGVVDILTDSTSMYHDGAVKNAAEMKAHVDSLGKSVEGSGIGAALSWVADTAGAAALFMGNSMLLQLDEFVKGLGWAINGLGDFYGSINKFLGIAQLGKDGPAGAAGGYGGPTTEESAPTLFVKSLNEFGGRADAERAKTKAVSGGGGTNIQKVEIVVSTNADPSRVARAAVDRLADLSRNPTSSRMVRNWSSVRP
jgi:hypothetical protein